MARGEVNYVNIVSNAGAVLRRVIIAEHQDLIPASNRNLRNERQEVVRYSSWIFPDKTGLMRAGRIEIPE